MNCPVCQKPVDALRARFVRVVAGGVAAYCSEACKNQDASGRGDVLAAGRSDGRAAAGARVVATVVPTAVPTVVARSTSAPVADRENGGMPSAQTSVTAEIAVPSVELAGAVRAAARAAAPGVDVAAVNSNSSSEVNATAPTTVMAKPAVASAALAATGQPAPVKSDDKAARDLGKARAAAAAPGAVVGVSASLPTVSASAAAPDAGDAPPANRRAWLLGGIVLVLALAGLAYVKFAAHPKSTAPAPAMVQSATVVDTSLRVDAVVAPSAADVKARALQVLRELMDSSVPRVQRVAAAALARTGDTKAIAKLQRLIASEQSALAKLEMSYAIARGGDKSGRLLLQQALTASGRDQKGDAATLLVQLHDGAETAAVATLTGFLSISQHRLSAAEALAPLRTAAAIKVLDEMAISTTIPADQRSRAVIALAHAGRRDVIPQLTKLLTDPLYNAAAAIALAALGEVSAAPVLREHLRLTSLQVAAARSLRKLAVTAPSVLPAEVIVALADALQGDKDTVRAGAAEVVLLLTGDAAWTEFE
ncbi:MAG: hypothetical protein KBG15_08740 [Kofleriaceae bacterium]|nr:hypothetical protein [Kofleriaceae bacterium]